MHTSRSWVKVNTLTFLLFSILMQKMLTIHKGQNPSNYQSQSNHLSTQWTLTLSYSKLFQSWKRKSIRGRKKTKKKQTISLLKYFLHQQFYIKKKKKTLIRILAISKKKKKNPFLLSKTMVNVDDDYYYYQ